MDLEMIKQQEPICTKLGERAFIEGKPSVPGKDQNLMDILRFTTEAKQSAVLKKAWSDGWYAANIQGIKEGV